MKSIFVCILLVISSVIAAAEFDMSAVYKANPAKWEKRIQNFEAYAKKANFEPGRIVCVGSSSMAMWHRRIEKDLAPLHIIKRGFGGSNYNDALHYADRIITNYKPRAVLVYEGDNDIAQGVSPEHVAMACKTFVEHLRGKLPDVRVYVISVKPSIARQKMWADMQKANALMKQFCDTHDYLRFIDVGAVLCNEDGSIKDDIFIKDKLHLNDKGYDLWSATIKKVLMEHEMKYQEQ